VCLSSTIAGTGLQLLLDIMWAEARNY